MNNFFNFKMDFAKSLNENLDEFNKIVISLTNIEENISYENQTIIILNSLTDSFKDVKTAIKSSRESLSLNYVLGALKSKDLEFEFERKTINGGLQVRGITDERNNQRDKKTSKSKKTWWQCHKKGHFKKNCL